MIRPYAFINRYVDFPTASSIYSFNVNLFFTDSSGISGTSRAINYYLNVVNNTVLASPSLVNIFGLPTNGNSYTKTNYTLGTSFGAVFTRNVSGVGRQQDQISIYRGSDTTFNVLQQYDTATFDYGILQTAVPITIQRNQSTNAIIGTLGNNTMITANNSTIYRLDKSSNRGDQVSSVWSVYKFDPTTGSTPVLATSGSDYQLITGTLSDDVIDIQFLNNSVNFQVRNTATGFTFASNPYYNFAGDSSQNVAINSTIFQLVTTSITYQILYPQIDVALSVPSDVLINTTPFSTYQGQSIMVQGEVLGNTGYYKQVNGSVITPIVKSNNEWQQIMTTDCNVVLNISDKVTGIIYQTLNGFGPYLVTLPNVNNYNFLYVTTSIVASASDTTTTTSSTSSTTTSSTTSTTTTQAPNVHISNESFGAVISTVAGIQGFLSTPLSYNQSQDGIHTAFTSTISVDITTGPSSDSNLYLTGAFTQTIPVSAGFVGIKIFSSHIYTSLSVIDITLALPF